MKKLLFCLLALLPISALHAQIHFGIEAGSNISNYNVNAKDPITGDSKKESTSAIWGPRAGILVDIGSSGFFVQPGVFYAVNGYYYSDPSGFGSTTALITTIEIPINFILKFGEPGRGRFFVGAGPYIGYNISGTTTSFGSDHTMSFGSDKTKDDLMALDYGAGACLGYQFGFGLFFRAHYQMGFANLAVDNSAGTITNYHFGVTGGFVFGEGRGGGGGGGHRRIGRSHRSHRSTMPWR